MGDEKTYAQLVRQSFLEAKAIIGKANNQEFKFIEREVKLSIDVELDTFFRNYLEKFTSIPVLLRRIPWLFPFERQMLDCRSSRWLAQFFSQDSLLYQLYSPME